MTPAKRLFRIQNLSCTRGQRLLFQKVSFDVAAGAAVHLHGANGVGKTSLLRILAGALPKDSGAVLWEGADFLKDGQHHHATRFSYLPADDRYLKTLETASENLLFWASLWNINTPEEICRASLAAFGLTRLADRPVRVFSAGQKRRLSLARLLLCAAPLWLLDEPLNGLDAASATLFCAALEKHLAGGGMAVIASHLPIAGTAVTRLEMTSFRQTAT